MQNPPGQSAIKNYVRDWDPCGLITAEAPSNEYDPEAYELFLWYEKNQDADREAVAEKFYQIITGRLSVDPKGFHDDCRKRGGGLKSALDGKDNSAQNKMVLAGDMPVARVRSEAKKHLAPRFGGQFEFYKREGNIGWAIHDGKYTYGYELSFPSRFGKGFKHVAISTSFNRWKGNDPTKEPLKSKAYKIGRRERRQMANTFLDNQEKWSASEGHPVKVGRMRRYSIATWQPLENIIFENLDEMQQWLDYYWLKTWSSFIKFVGNDRLLEGEGVLAIAEEAKISRAKLVGSSIVYNGEQSMHTRNAIEAYKSLQRFLEQNVAEVKERSITLEYECFAYSRREDSLAKLLRKRLENDFGKADKNENNHLVPLPWLTYGRTLEWNINGARAEEAVGYLDALAIPKELQPRPVVRLSVSVDFRLNGVLDHGDDSSAFLARLSSSSNGMFLTLELPESKDLETFEACRRELQKSCPIKLEDKNFIVRNRYDNGNFTHRKLYKDGHAELT
ncbi:hypothetical protein JNJ66_00820 [Candidatus Saccharibacteria bacterium]|nr:hypothetical protein [Candidatus Saccharibacteria bacterium]